MSKDIKTILKEMENRGWIFKSHNCHIKMMSPNGWTLTVPCTPSCHRALKNLKKQIERIEKRPNAGTPEASVYLGEIA